MIKWQKKYGIRGKIKKNKMYAETCLIYDTAEPVSRYPFPFLPSFIFIHYLHGII